jgi:hypothetical protein
MEIYLIRYLLLSKKLIFKFVNFKFKFFFLSFYYYFKIFMKKKYFFLLFLVYLRRIWGYFREFVAEIFVILVGGINRFKVE